MLSNRQTSGLLPEGATYRNGTCMTAPECTQKGGSESSSCAGGYILILYENATVHDSHKIIYKYNVHVNFIEIVFQVWSMLCIYGYCLR